MLRKTGESLDLRSSGLDGTVLSTSGHSEGSLSIMLPERQAIVGDLLSAGLLPGGIDGTGRAKPSPFGDDAHRVAAELSKLLERNIELFYLGHGGPVSSEVRGKVGHG